jgi:hypothetical protein
VDACLVADRYQTRNVGEVSRRGLDSPIVGRPAEVRGVEVRKVVVSDAVIGRASGDHVPDCLGDAAGGKVPVRQRQPARSLEHLRDPLVLAEDGLEQVDLRVCCRRRFYLIGALLKIP